MIWWFFLGFTIGMIMVMKNTCVNGHNYVDKGKYIKCTKCGMTYLKAKRRNR